MNIHSMGKEYRDKAWLRKHYVQKAKPMQEIADECACSVATIYNWIEKHDLPHRSKSESLRRAHGTNDGKYNDAEWLRQEYVEKGRSAIDMSEECGVHFDTIYKRLKEHNIPRRTIKEATNLSDKYGFKGRDHPRWNESIVPYYTHSRDNYVCWSHNWDNTRDHVFVHRLIAVAEYGIDAVKGKEVHHKNGIKWDNRPDNLELLTSSEHTKLHHEQGDYPQSAE